MAAIWGLSLSAHLCSLPAGFRLNASSWPMFLLKTLNGAEMAPIRIFHKVLGCLGAHPPPAWGTSALPALPCAAPPGSSVLLLLAQGRAQCLHSTVWAVPSSLGMRARQLTGLTATPSAPSARGGEWRWRGSPAPAGHRRSLSSFSFSHRNHHLHPKTSSRQV